MRHHPDQDIVATFKLRRRNVVRAKFTEGSDHEELYNREKPNQHPIEAITDLAETLELKQNLLISGVNIKTINNESILGEGNIDIQGGGGGGNVDDVQVNGTSVVSNKVADIKLKTVNGNDINGEGNIAIKTYQPFNSNWTVNSTTAQLCSDIDNDTNAIAGMAYLGILRNSDLPNHMMQADAVVEIIGESGGSKVIHITITSADQYPYRWEYSYFNEHSINGWIGFQPELISGTNIKTVNNESILGTGNLEIKSGSELNEFVITQEIFDEYKNENDYADLEDIINSEEITQKVINLNNFDYFLTGLVGSNKTLLFKNGTIVLGTSGINDSINNAITLSNSKLGFKDCEIIVNDSITTEPEKPIIDLNNTDLTFDNVIADNFTFTTFKTFIQTTNTCNIVLKDTLFDIIDKLINYDPEEDEKRPSMKFIKVLTNGSSVKFINSMVDISTEKLIDNINPGLCQNIIVETIGLVTVKLEILNSILQLRAEGGHGEGGISSRPPRCLDINLDNLDIILIDSLMSCFNSDGFNVRPESSYGLEPNKSFTTNDPYMVFFEPNIDIFQGDDEAEDYEPKFENINIDKYLFVNTVEYIEGDYHFTYNGSDWDVTANSFDEDDTIIRTLDTNITIEQIEEKYGLTFNLIEGKILEQGDDITLELVLNSSYYKILKNFTAESNSEEYFNELNYNIDEVTDLAEEIETVNYDNEKFANALAEVLERNGKHLKPHSEYDEEQEVETDVMAKIGFWYDEDNGDPNVWKIEIDPEWIEEDRHLMDDVDLRDFGLEVIIKDGQEIHNLSGFTVVVEPKVESTTVSIKENTNSVITGNPFEEDFPWLENKQPLGMFSTELVGFSQVKSIQAENIKTNNISVSDEYYLPVDNENLESNNVKDAINELANKESSASSLFDIKTILTADAEANKGWACTCYDEPHKLNEEQVAGAYHEIENMLNQTVETKIELTNKTDVNMNVRNMFYGGGFYYFVIGNGTNAVVKRSDNVNGENLEDVVNVGEELNPENDYSLVVCNCIERDNEIYFMFYFADTSFGDDYTLLYDKDWNLVVKYISDASIMPYIFGSNAVFGKNEYSNKIFIPSVVYDYNDPEGSIASVRLIIYDIDSGNYEVILKSLSDSSFNYMSTQTSFYDNKIWISTSSQVISIDLDNNYNIFINTELIPSNSTGFITGMTYVKSSIIDEEETIDTLYFIYSDTTNENSFFKILRYNDDNVWEEVYYDEGDANEYNYVTDVKNYNEKTIISTGNNIYISRNLNDIESLYQINNAGDLIINDNILSVKGTVNSDGYSYFDIEENKIEFTDTYNINGEDVDINYYKSGEYKICEAGQNNRDDGEDENDSKLQDVYEYLGYLPYFWIDTENLDIVLPRNSNRWTMMYVGNNYVEEEMPEGNYLPFATKPIKLTNITASNWIEDDTFEDYGYKCEIECEGVNENMFAQVVFSIEEANSGNYASVCDTAENKVIIYSKVNDTITIPTIVIMEA